MRNMLMLTAQLKLSATRLVSMLSKPEAAQICQWTVGSLGAFSLGTDRYLG
jgi:hypothetical protein